MPTEVRGEIRNLSQREFARVAYDVMSEVFAVHRELGRLFDERVYRAALVERMQDVRSEVRIDVSFRGFRKSYFMDILASPGAVFELKAVRTITDGHRGQLLNYLLLTGLQHGKLANLRTERVQHEFVNAALTHAERTEFAVDDSQWRATPGFRSEQKTFVVEMLKDWGTCLSRALYEEAVVHSLGGAERVFSDVGVCVAQTRLAKQTVALCADRTAFRLTTFEDTSTDGYRKALIQFLNCTELDAIQWINISRNELTFETLR